MRTTSPLSIVQNLYTMQFDLQNYLLSESIAETEWKEAKEKCKTFRALLKKADPGVTGGDDILDELEDLVEDVEAKVKA